MIQDEPLCLFTGFYGTSSTCHPVKVENRSCVCVCLALPKHCKTVRLPGVHYSQSHFAYRWCHSVSSSGPKTTTKIPGSKILVNHCICRDRMNFNPCGVWWSSLSETRFAHLGFHFTNTDHSKGVLLVLNTQNHKLRLTEIPKYISPTMKRPLLR